MSFFLIASFVLCFVGHVKCSKPLFIQRWVWCLPWTPRGEGSGTGGRSLRTRCRRSPRSCRRRGRSRAAGRSHSRAGGSNSSPSSCWSQSPRTHRSLGCVCGAARYPRPPPHPQQLCDSVLHKTVNTCGTLNHTSDIFLSPFSLLLSPPPPPPARGHRFGPGWARHPQWPHQGACLDSAVGSCPSSAHIRLPPSLCRRRPNPSWRSKTAADVSSLRTGRC